MPEQGQRERSDLKFLAVALNPTIQRTLVLPHLWEGEVNRCAEQRLDAAGKGMNVSRVLAQLGEPVVYLTQCGGRDGELFLELARRDGVSVSVVAVDAEARTATTLINREKGTTTEIVEEGRPVTRETDRQVRARFAELLPRCHTVIISGSKAPGFAPDLYPWMVEQARRADRTVVVDYRGEDLMRSLAARPDVIKPNFAEFVLTFFGDADVREQETNQALLRRVEERMLQLCRDHGTLTVLTRGRHETLYVDDGAVRRETPPQVVAVNTIGSGDAFTAGFAAARRLGASMPQAVRKGHECACLNVGLLRPGVIR